MLLTSHLFNSIFDTNIIPHDFNFLQGVWEWNDSGFCVCLDSFDGLSILSNNFGFQALLDEQLELENISIDLIV